MDTNELFGARWTIRSVDLYAGLVKDDKLQFIEATNGITILMNGTTNWATNCVLAGSVITGTTSGDQRAFTIRLDDPSLHHLSCYFEDSASQTSMLRAVALGATLGTLIGAAAGVGGGRPLAGALVGLAAASTGALVVARSVQDPTTAGSSVSFVADDGRAGRPPGTMPRFHAAQG